MLVYLNGEYVDAAHAHVPIRDRGFLFADGIFETARLHRGRYFRLGEHLARLRRSGAIVRIPVPPDEQLAEVTAELARRTRLGEATLRITLTRGGSDAAAGTFLVSLEPLAADWRERAARGWSAIIARTRRPAPAAVPPELKGLGRPYAILARLEAVQAGVNDAVMLAADGAIAEGPSWNIFWRRDRRLYTPALGVGILGGITRAIVLELAPELGLTVSEGSYAADRLPGADEVFATMTSLGVVPLTSIDGLDLPTDRPTTAELQRRYWQIVGDECGPE